MAESKFDSSSINTVPSAGNGSAPQKWINETIQKTTQILIFSVLLDPNTKQSLVLKVVVILFDF
jgi:hypothetical protein